MAIKKRKRRVKSIDIVKYICYSDCSCGVERDAQEEQEAMKQLTIEASELKKARIEAYKKGMFILDDGWNTSFYECTKDEFMQNTQGDIEGCERECLGMEKSNVVAKTNKPVEDTAISSVKVVDMKQTKETVKTAKTETEKTETLTVKDIKEALKGMGVSFIATKLVKVTSEVDTARVKSLAWIELSDKMAIAKEGEKITAVKDIKAEKYFILSSKDDTLSTMEREHDNGNGRTDLYNVGYKTPIITDKTYSDKSMMLAIYLLKGAKIGNSFDLGTLISDSTNEQKSVLKAYGNIFTPNDIKTAIRIYYASATNNCIINASKMENLKNIQASMYIVTCDKKNRVIIKCVPYSANLFSFETQAEHDARIERAKNEKIDKVASKKSEVKVA